MDELPLRRHDFQGNPAALLASFIERFDLLKEELVTAEDYERWAAGLADDDERAEREREFAAVYAAHDRMLREAGTLDSGELVVLARRLLREDADVRAARLRPRGLGDRWTTSTTPRAPSSRCSSCSPGPPET